MGNKPSKAASTRVSHAQAKKSSQSNEVPDSLTSGRKPSGSAKPPSSTELMADTGVPNKPESGPTKTPRGKVAQQKGDIELCKHCHVLYLPTQLDNPYVKTKCGRHHPGKSGCENSALQTEY